MTLAVPAVFLDHVLPPRFVEIDTGLVGQTDQHEQNVGKFIGQFTGAGPLTVLETLVTVFPRDDAGQLTFPGGDVQRQLVRGVQAGP